MLCALLLPVVAARSQGEPQLRDGYHFMGDSSGMKGTYANRAAEYSESYKNYLAGLAGTYNSHFNSPHFQPAASAYVPQLQQTMGYLESKKPQLDGLISQYKRVFADWDNKDVELRRVSADSKELFKQMEDALSEIDRNNANEVRIGGRRDKKDFQTMTKETTKFGKDSSKKLKAKAKAFSTWQKKAKKTWKKAIKSVTKSWEKIVKKNTKSTEAYFNDAQNSAEELAEIPEMVDLLGSQIENDVERVFNLFETSTTISDMEFSQFYRTLEEQIREVEDGSGESLEEMAESYKEHAEDEAETDAELGQEIDDELATAADYARDPLDSIKDNQRKLMKLKLQMRIQERQKSRFSTGVDNLKNELGSISESTEAALEKVNEDIQDRLHNAVPGLEDANEQARVEDSLSARSDQIQNKIENKGEAITTLYKRKKEDIAVTATNLLGREISSLNQVQGVVDELIRSAKKDSGLVARSRLSYKEAQRSVDSMVVAGTDLAKNVDERKARADKVRGDSIKATHDLRTWSEGQSEKFMKQAVGAINENYRRVKEDLDAEISRPMSDLAATQNSIRLFDRTLNSRATNAASDIETGIKTVNGLVEELGSFQPSVGASAADSKAEYDIVNVLIHDAVRELKAAAESGLDLMAGSQDARMGAVKQGLLANVKDSATKSALDTAAFLEGLEEVARKTREEKAATRDTRVLKGRLEAALPRIERAEGAAAPYGKMFSELMSADAAELQKLRAPRATAESEAGKIIVQERLKSEEEFEKTLKQFQEASDRVKGVYITASENALQNSRTQLVQVMKEKERDLDALFARYQEAEKEITKFVASAPDLLEGQGEKYLAKIKASMGNFKTTQKDFGKDARAVLFHFGRHEQKYLQQLSTSFTDSFSKESLAGFEDLAKQKEASQEAKVRESGMSYDALTRHARDVLAAGQNEAAQEKFESSALSGRVHREAQGLERSVGNVISMVGGNEEKSYGEVQMASDRNAQASADTRNKIRLANRQIKSFLRSAADAIRAGKSTIEDNFREYSSSAPETLSESSIRTLRRTLDTGTNLAIQGAEEVRRLAAKVSPKVSAATQALSKVERDYSTNIADAKTRSADNSNFEKLQEDGEALNQSVNDLSPRLDDSASRVERVLAARSLKFMQKLNYTEEHEGLSAILNLPNMSTLSATLGAASNASDLLSDKLQGVQMYLNARQYLIAKAFDDAGYSLNMTQVAQEAAFNHANSIDDSELGRAQLRIGLGSQKREIERQLAAAAAQLRADCAAIANSNLPPEEKARLIAELRRNAREEQMEMNKMRAGLAKKYEFLLGATHKDHARLEGIEERAKILSDQLTEQLAYEGRNFGKRKASLEQGFVRLRALMASEGGHTSLLETTSRSQSMSARANQVAAAVTAVDDELAAEDAAIDRQLVEEHVI